MYNWDKSLREDKLRNNTQNPSFSSCLLDEIYRSIDGVDENSGGFMLRKEKVAKKQSISNGGGGRARASSAAEDDETASFRRACLVEKWMKMKVNDKVRPSLLPEFDRKPVLDNDPLFFSSGSSSSDSSFGWFSEQESFRAVKPKPSCVGPFNRPKPVKTGVSPRSATKKQNEFYLFDDDDHQTNKTDHQGLIKSKSRALKIYTSLKMVKQPISPGGRLTSFLNALFTNGHVKKPKVLDSVDTRIRRNSKSTHGSSCSSASSFSRSCLSKNSPSLKERLNNETRRTVRFCPVSVIVDEDSRPCGEKIICDEQDFEPWQRNKMSNFVHLTEKHNAREFSMTYSDEKKNIEYKDCDDDDMASDSSSDLFELDHLAIFKNDEYCEELPVYETTHFGTNRAIARGFIC